MIFGEDFFMRKRRKAERGEWSAAVRAIAIGLLFGVLFTAFLMAAAAYGFNAMRKIPHAAVAITVVLLSAVGSFASGFSSARLLKQRGLPVGMAAGLLLFLLFTGAGIAMHSLFSWGGFFTRFAVMLLSGALGGYAGVSTIRKKR